MPKPVFVTLHFKALKSRLMKLGYGRHEIGFMLFYVSTMFLSYFDQFHAYSILINFMPISCQFRAYFVPISYFVPKPVFATLHFKP